MKGLTPWVHVEIHGCKYNLPSYLIFLHFNLASICPGLVDSNLTVITDNTVHYCNLVDSLQSSGALHILDFFASTKKVYRAKQMKLEWLYLSGVEV